VALVALRELFGWFRERFPYYRGACGACAEAKTEFLGLVRASPLERMSGGAAVAELYRCTACGVRTSFPRFRTVPPVLASKRGRCGEYSWTALRLLEALGFEARWVDNHAGHVWVEARVQGRWVHIDPCEAAVDTPLLYAENWGRCPKHVLAYGLCRDALGGQSNLVAISDVTGQYRPVSAEPIPEEARLALEEAIAQATASEVRRAGQVAASALASAKAAVGTTAGAPVGIGAAGGLGVVEGSGR